MSQVGRNQSVKAFSGSTRPSERLTGVALCADSENHVFGEIGNQYPRVIKGIHDHPLMQSSIETRLQCSSRVIVKRTKKHLPTLWFLKEPWTAV